MIPLTVYVDLVAQDPTAETFHARVNGPAWPRLWGWAGVAHGDILDVATFGRGMVPIEPVKVDVETCVRLGFALDADLADGTFEKARQAMLDDYGSRDLVDCSHCDGTGVRTDEVGRLMRLDEIELDEATALVVGRSTGSCDACDGFGRHADPETLFTFERETVEAFASFLRSCGGMVIL